MRVLCAAYARRVPDEEDEFGSDFTSTDEEADATTADIGERELGDEERRARKVCRRPGH